MARLSLGNKIPAGLQTRVTTTMALTLEEKRARNRAYAAKYREKNRERTRERYAEKMKDPAFQESERVRALEKYYRTRSLDVKPVGRPRKHVYTPEQESRFERAKEERAKEVRLSGEK